MNKEDSLILRSIAEVALTGYTDAYGNTNNVADQIIRSWKPSEAFYGRLEKKLDTEAIAKNMVESFGKLSNYDKQALRDSIHKRAKEIAAERLAAEMMKDLKSNNENS